MRKLYLFLKSFKTGADLMAHNLSLYDLEALASVYNQIIRNKKAYFLNSKIFKVLMQLDCFNISINGIGWMATPKN